MIKVSVVIPVYNEEQYLGNCLDTICSQSLKEIEIICVDDGSTDESLHILQGYAKNDSRIRVITQKNQYAGVARNNGMSYATGKYLSFLDADDYFESNMLEKMYQMAEEGNDDIVVCRYNQFCEKTKKMENIDWSFINSFFYQKKQFTGEKLKYAGIFQITNGWPWDKLFRTDFVRQVDVKFSSFRSSEDGFFVYTLMLLAKRITYIDDILLTHRVNQTNSLSSTKDDDWMNGFYMLRLIMNEMKKMNIYDTYRQSFLNKVVDFLSWYLESMHSYKAYKNCYNYIQTEVEVKMKILTYNTEFFFKEKLIQWYRELNNSTLEEFLFKGKEKYFSVLNHQRIEINKQSDALFRQGIVLDKQREALDKQKEALDKQREALSERDWVFPFRFFEKGKTIVLYGAGKVGSAYYEQLSQSKFCKDVIWVDKEYGKYLKMGLKVQDPDVIFIKKYDYIFLAVKSKEIQREIMEWLTSRGIQTDIIKYYGME